MTHYTFSKLQKKELTFCFLCQYILTLEIWDENWKFKKDLEKIGNLEKIGKFKKNLEIWKKIWKLGNLKKNGNNMFRKNLEIRKIFGHLEID